jgi:hypothetical protein
METLQNIEFDPLNSDQISQICIKYKLGSGEESEIQNKIKLLQKFENIQMNEYKDEFPFYENDGFLKNDEFFLKSPYDLIDFEIQIQPSKNQLLNKQNFEKFIKIEPFST